MVLYIAIVISLVFIVTGTQFYWEAMKQAWDESGKEDDWNA